MATYNLDEDEIVIMQDSTVTDQSNHHVTLVLTNKHILVLEQGLLGKIKETCRLSLSDLKENSGAPNVLVGKAPNGKTRLELYFSQSQYYYIFKGLLAEKKWAAAIIKAYKALIKERVKSEAGQFDTSKIIAPVIGRLDAAKNAVLSAQKEKKAKTISSKCPYCGAAVIGSKGYEIRCEYCEAVFIIK